jgi:Ca2+-binding RTX toxin-like protein
MAYYPSSIDTDALDGSNGFDIAGATPDDRLGVSVANAGDVNGDGLADIIVSGRDRVGNLVYNYVVFGTGEPLPADFDVATLNGENGFRIITAAPEKVWYVQTAGDLNGDGYSDLMVGTSNDGYPYGYDDIQVIFGRADGFERLFSLIDIDGENGFTLNGPPRTDTNYSIAAAGDTNGDGYDDVLITINYNARLLLGSADGFAADALVDDVAATIFSPTQWGYAPPAGIGDINGDGFDDIAVGEAILFGSAAGFTGDLTPEMLDGSNGFRLAPDVNRAISAAGDVNGDGIDDFIVGNPNARPHGHIDGGEAYVVFGTTSGFDATLDLEALDGADGFVIRGPTLSSLGVAVSGAGDVNGDGFDDVLVQTGYGRAHVIFGRASYHTPGFDVDELDGRHGFEIDGSNPYAGLDDIAGLGDFNGDGFADMAFGESQASPDGKSLAGTVHIVFGLKPTEPVTRIDAAGDQTVRGGLGNDVLISHGGDDHLIGDAGNDSLRSMAGADILEGGLGNDEYFVLADHSDTIIDTGGIDTIRTTTDWDLGGYASIENVTLSAAGNQQVSGNALGNRIIGSFGDNLLSGREGNDRLEGGHGADMLVGGQGRDILIGGVGADHFVFSDADAGYRDVITDFEQGLDRIDLSQVDAMSERSGNQAFGFIGTHPFTGAAGELRVDYLSYSDGTVVTIVEGDRDGDGAADFQIELRGQHLPTAADFIL